MNDYLTPEQIAQLLRAINPKRVSTDGKGFSHVEAYEIKAHLNRVIGFARWSADLLDMRCIYEDGQTKQGKNGEYTAWSVCYLATMRLTICAPDGTQLATYTEAATGEAKNQPHRGDAHDLAIKTAESQALKRCAINLGDNYGLSLYAKGSTSALVRQTLVLPGKPEDKQDGPPVDAHITQQLPREGETPEPQAEPRITSTPAAPPAGPAAGDDPVPSPAAAPNLDKQRDEAQRIRNLAAGDIPTEYRNIPSKWVMHLTGEAVKAKVLMEPVESLISPNKVALKVVLEQALKQATAAEQPRERAS